MLLQIGPSGKRFESRNSGRKHFRNNMIFPNYFFSTSTRVILEISFLLLKTVPSNAHLTQII